MSELDQLLADLDSSDWVKREATLYALPDYAEALVQPPRVDQLVALLEARARDKHSAVRMAVAECLQFLRPPNVERLISMLAGDAHEGVQRKAEAAARRWRPSVKRPKSSATKALESLRKKDPELARLAERAARAMVQESTREIAHDFAHHAGTIEGLVGRVRRAVGAGRPLDRHLDGISRVAGVVGELSRSLKSYGNLSPLEFSQEPINELVQLATEAVRLSEKAKGVEVEAEVAAELFAEVPRASFVSLVENLLRNAIDEAAKQTLERRRKVRIEAMSEDMDLVLRIADRGNGFPSAEFDQWLLPGTSTKKGGREPNFGMGLANVGQTIDRCGGQLTIESSPEGATITVRLPLSQVGP